RSARVDLAGGAARDRTVIDRPVVERTWSHTALAVILAVVACGGERAREPAPRAAAPATRPAPAVGEAAAEPPPRSPLAPAFALLPTAIVAAEPTPIAWLNDQLVAAVAPVFDAACWRALAATIDGYYAIDLVGAPERVVFHPHLIHGQVELAALRACRVPAARRREATHARVLVASDGGFFPVVFADLGHGWFLMIDGEIAPILAAAEALAAAAPATANPLADLVGRSATPGWRALAGDVTRASLGVPALGARAEFTPFTGLGPPPGPVTVTVFFASAADAQRALAAATASGGSIDREAVGDVVALAGTLGEVRVDGATVVYRGPVSAALFDSLGLFRVP
ncbi:MAG: hypothetical protein KA201_36725, partial [Kofleriaceae bacterium]|nr:hypothetical protein [Kofleriaceae bacterium]